MQKILTAILEQIPETKVVVASGSEAESNATRAIATGVFKFYSKSVEIKVLLNIIEKAYQAYK